jgi:hypothetical protein
VKTKLSVIAGTTLLLAVGAFMWRGTPSGLHIHIQSMPWESVAVESANLSQPLRFTSTTSDLLVAPIAHGVYRIGIHFPDGRTVWSAYLHHDAGARRRVDLFVSPSTRAGYFHFRQTANRTHHLFTGETRPEDTTKEKPFQLDCI